MHDSVSVSDEIGAELYIYCKTRARLDQLRGHVMSLMTVSDPTMPIFLDCEGRDLGRIGGKLGLIQLGIEERVYLVDVVECPESLETLKMILENQKFEKITWDGRSDFAELWHEHGIALRRVLDLQLLRVHENPRVHQRGYIRLEGMGKMFLDLVKRDGIKNPGIDLNKLAESTPKLLV